MRSYLRDSRKLTSHFSVWLIFLSIFLIGCTSTIQEIPIEQYFLEDYEIVPGWQAGDLFPPYGDDLYTDQSAGQHYSVSEREPSIQAMFYVYRYRSAGVASRSFEIVYLHSATIRHDAVDGWQFESNLADSYHFGCYTTGIDYASESCEWGALYGDTIVVFTTRLVPGEMLLSDMERVVRDFDTHMEELLSEEK